MSAKPPPTATRTGNRCRTLRVRPFHCGTTTRSRWIGGSYPDLAAFIVLPQRARRLPAPTEQRCRDDQRMLIARAMTRAASARETIDSTTIISFAQTRTADTSVGLNARAVLNDRAR
jgi:hypothetical protein